MSLRSPIRGPIRSPVYSPTVGKWGGGYTEANLLALLAKGTSGFWHGGQLSALFQGTDETTPAVSANDPIGRSRDRSAFGQHATQATNKPTLQFDGSTPLVRGNGSSANLLTPLVPSLSAAGGMLLAKVKATATGANKIIIGAGTTSTWCAIEIKSNGLAGVRYVQRSHPTTSKPEPYKASRVRRLRTWQS